MDSLHPLKCLFLSVVFITLFVGSTYSAVIVQEPNVIVWKKYFNKEYKFSFAYPAVYDEPQYKRCGIREFHKGSFHIGSRIFLTIENAAGLSLKAFVDQTVKKKKGPYWRVVDRHNEVVNGLKAIRIDYRFGGMGRFGRAVFIKRGNDFFIIEASAGVSVCDLGDQGIEEFIMEYDHECVFNHIIRTFKGAD